MEFIKETLADLRHKNRLQILEIIKQSEFTSRAHIAKLLKMSRSNVSEIVQMLVQEGLVNEQGTGSSTSQGGRKPRQLQFVPDAKFALGIDIGASKTIAMVTNLNGKCIARTKFSSRLTGDGSSLEHIRDHVVEFLEKNHFPFSKIVATGIGVPTVTNHHTGDVNFVPGLSDGNVNIRALFSGQLPEPLYVDNDVNMAVVGERWTGNGQGCNNMVFVGVGNGIGAGIIVNGDVLRGMSGLAGEIGYFHLNPLTEEPGTDISKYGPLDSIASGKAVEEQVKFYRPKFPNSKLEYGMDMAEIFAKAEANDSLALYLVDRMTKYIAFAISHLVLVLNPERVLLGGGVSQAGEPFVGRIRDRVQSLTPMRVDIVPARLGEDSAAYGAAATALQETENLNIF